MTALTLPAGITEERAISVARGHLLACKRAHPCDEERALTEFEKITRQMCLGHEPSAKRLRQLAVYAV